MKNVMKARIKSCVRAILFFCCMLWGLHANAQTWPDTSKSYHLLLEPYLFTPAMSGNMDVGRLPKTFVCIPAGKVLSYLQFGAMLYAEVHNDRFAYTIGSTLCIPWAGCFR